MDGLTLSLGDLVQRYGGLLLPIVSWVAVVGILACSIGVMAIFIERSLSLRRHRVMPSRFLDQVRRYVYRGDIHALLEYCDDQSVPLARILRAGLARYESGVREVEKALENAGQIEATALMHYVRGLGVIANLAPMLGFLGTVTGMIKAFNAIAAAGSSHPSLVASGISEALLTTAAGLVVGIPALALFHLFRSRADQLIAAMETVTLELLEDITLHQNRSLRAEEQADAV